LANIINTYLKNFPGISYKSCLRGERLIRTWLYVDLLRVGSYYKSRDSSVGIALGYGLDDRGSSVWFPAGVGNLTLHHRIQNGSGAHPASYPVGIRGSFPGKSFRCVKLTTHLLLVPRSKNAWSYTSTPQYAIMTWCFVNHRDNFTCTFLLRIIEELFRISRGTGGYDKWSRHFLQFFQMTVS
jgi:hypothetical protein